jgi:hypothetical protein
VKPDAALRLLAQQPADVRDAVRAVLRGLVACEEAVRYFGLGVVVEGLVGRLEGQLCHANE